ncbi:amidohydrolase [Paenibacillus sp. FSL R10-2778]|uniref:amidohydrolase n=1 Tax=Paenibacillus sp. FSL R10-2778 TaxID=2954659 RepID=UPI00315847F2
MGTIEIRSEAIEHISGTIEHKRELLASINDRIWEFAETRYEEARSAELFAQILEQEGFEVERAAGGIPTAVIGSFGTGSPVIGILGEYDALFGLSQEKGLSSKQPVVEGGNGHGCGHNLLGSGALAAVIGVEQYLLDQGLSGTVRFYGCPAEEGGGGKGLMVKRGLFEGVDAAITWHPGPANYINSATLLATRQVYFQFKGRSAHAAAAPHLGRSALDGVELTNMGVNYLREHMESDCRIHYAITNTGGISPNVVQAEAEVLYKLRVPRSEQLADLYERIVRIAEGAALMTGTELVIRPDSGASELIMNRTLERAAYAVFQEIGVPDFDAAELEFASRIRTTLTEQDKLDGLPSGLEGKALSDRLEPYSPQDHLVMGSSDLGDVSWQIPMVQCYVASMALGTPLHTWQVVSQGASSSAHKALLHAGKLMGLTALELFLQPEVLEQAKAEHRHQVTGRSYLCPISDDVVPGPIKR